MKVINAGYKILTDISEGGVKELKHIERIGRVCYKSENKITESEESAKEFVGMLVSVGHESALEHSSLSVQFTVDRGITHELVRHRLMSFAQESTRYCNYNHDRFGNEITVIFPCWISDKTEESYKLWEVAMLESERKYFELLNKGWSAQMARNVLPNSIKSDITLTGNYREWRHFFKLRACGIYGPPHPQMLEVTIPLLKEVSTKIPVIFDDLLDYVK